MSQLVWTKMDEPHRFEAPSGKLGKKYSVTYDCGVWRVNWDGAPIPNPDDRDRWTFMLCEKAKAAAQSFEDDVPGDDLPTSIASEPNPLFFLTQTDKKQPSVFTSETVSPDWEPKQVPLTPQFNLFSAVSRAMGQWLRSQSGLTTGELIRESMDRPAVPYEPTWGGTDLFCPHCGAAGLLVEEGDGDVEMSQQHKCGSCNETCYIW